MKLNVYMPKEGEFNVPSSWKEVLSLLDEKVDLLENLGKEAFKDKEHDAWIKAQQLLYHWNKEVFNEQARADDYATTVKTHLRNVLIKAEQDALNTTDPIVLLCHNCFTKDRAVDELYERARNHRMNSHPLLRKMACEGLPQNVARLFIENWNTDSDIFHLYIAAQSLSTPFELRGELYKNLYEELGEGDISQAHPTLLAESLHVFNTQVYYTLLSGNYCKSLGGFGFIEFNVSTQMTQIYQGLLKSGIPDKDSYFWPLHIELDKEHGEVWFEEIKEVISSPEDARAILEGGVLDARARMLDGIMAFYNNEMKVLVSEQRKACT